MPLPNDQRIVDLAEELLQQFKTIFGAHPGYRPAHAKGIMLSGMFRPAPAAATLSRAPHFTRSSTPITVRFSNSTGLPDIPDTSPDASPRGLAIRFNLAEHVHTDIVSHSVDGFPVRDGAQFLEFLKAAIASGPDVPSPKPIENFLAGHPAAAAFVKTPKPFPSSLARLTYYGVTAFAFTNAAGETKFGRYRIVPEAGSEYFADSKAAGLGPNYHFDEIVQRVAGGPIRFRLVIQIAETGDIVDDATIHWPQTRKLLDAGVIELTKTVPDLMAAQKRIIFDPIPRVDGIEPSADPLLELRAAVYLISGRERRSAP